jgi:hypothetical protein
LTLTVTLAKNILIHEQIDEIASATSLSGVPIVLLKGAALVELFESYSHSREMEDIDILVRPEDLKKTTQLLLDIGYLRATSDASSFIHPAKPAQVDLCDGLWYLSYKENRNLFGRALNNRLQTFSDSVYRLEAVDFYIHTFAHACIHHAELKEKNITDLRLIKGIFGFSDEDLLEERLKACGLLGVYRYYFDKTKLSKLKRSILGAVINLKIRDKGYVFRFLFLPASLKAGFLKELIFPSGDFLKARYDLKNPLSVFIFKVLRPFLLLFKLLRSLFSKKYI